MRGEPCKSRVPKQAKVGNRRVGAYTPTGISMARKASSIQPYLTDQGLLSEQATSRQATVLSGIYPLYCNLMDFFTSTS